MTVIEIEILRSYVATNQRQNLKLSLSNLEIHTWMICRRKQSDDYWLSDLCRYKVMWGNKTCYECSLIGSGVCNIGLKLLQMYRSGVAFFLIKSINCTERLCHHEWCLGEGL